MHPGSLHMPTSQNQMYPLWGRKLDTSAPTEAQEKRTHFCPWGCPASDHKPAHEKTEQDQMAESGDATLWFAPAGG